MAKWFKSILVHQIMILSEPYSGSNASIPSASSEQFSQSEAFRCFLFIDSATVKKQVLENNNKQYIDKNNRDRLISIFLTTSRCQNTLFCCKLLKYNYIQCFLRKWRQILKSKLEIAFRTIEFRIEPLFYFSAIFLIFQIVRNINKQTVVYRKDKIATTDQ